MVTGLRRQRVNKDGELAGKLLSDSKSAVKSHRKRDRAKARKMTEQGNYEELAAFYDAFSGRAKRKQSPTKEETNTDNEKSQQVPSSCCC